MATQTKSYDEISDLRDERDRWERYAKRLEAKIREMELAGGEQIVKKGMNRQARLAEPATPRSAGNDGWINYGAVTLGGCAELYCRDLGIAAEIEVRDTSEPDRIYRFPVAKCTTYRANTLPAGVVEYADKAGAAS